MLITFGKNVTVGDIKLQFQCAFPFLKIEFSEKPHKPGEYVKRAVWYADDYKIAKIAVYLQPDYIVIQPWHQTGEIESLFRNQFGLNVQIFRKEGDR